MRESGSARDACRRGPRAACAPPHAAGIATPAAHVTPGAHDARGTAFIHPLNTHIHCRTSSSSFALAVGVLPRPMQYPAPAQMTRHSPLQAPAHQGLLAVECTHVAGGCETERFWAQGVLNLGQSGRRCGASTAMREGLQRPLPPLAPPDKGGERRQTAWPCPRAGIAGGGGEQRRDSRSGWG